jgi:putative CRISPR-associated protein (TIGR02619 family)
MPQLVVSTCGTSILTNQAETTLFRSIVSQSNVTRPSAIIDRETRDKIQAHLAERKAQLATASTEEAARLSAEINGIRHLYPQGLDANDKHFLISTGTWLGSESATIIAQWLERSGSRAQVIPIPDLRTDDIDAFHVGLSELVKWCGQTLPSYRAEGWRVIFNLTGGFKSVQGFMQTLSHFYADEAVYVFESGKELLHLPGLPVELKLTDTVRNNLAVFRRLANELPVEMTEVPRALETFAFRFRLQGAPRTMLSAWGELVYRENRERIYKERLWESPSPLIRYGSELAAGASILAEEQIKLINERIDELAVCLELGSCSEQLGLVQLPDRSKYPATHKLNGWAIDKAPYIYGHYQDQVFILDSIG